MTLLPFIASTLKVMASVYGWRSCCFLVLMVFTFISHNAFATQWTIKAQRLNDQQPVISYLLKNSDFNYSYNPSWVPSPNGSPYDGLLVRCQNITSKTNEHIVGPSVMALVWRLGQFETAPMMFENLTQAQVVFQPSTPEEILGTEDPYVLFVSSQY